MKERHLLLALMMLVTVGVWAQKEYSVSKSTHYNIEHGGVNIKTQTCVVGGTAKVDVEPAPNYGLSRGLFYAKRNANGSLSVTHTARNTSSYPNDRGNHTQNFEFTMPDGDVEVWAYFDLLHSLIIHKSNTVIDKLVPLYGLAEQDNDSLVKNLPNVPIVLVPQLDEKHKDDYELVDVEVTNVNPSFVIKSADTVVIRLPNTDQTVHVTPIFGKKKYEMKIDGNIIHDKISISFSNPTPKAREEVDVIMMSEEGYIPANIRFSGCEPGWLKEKPVLQENGKWKTVYRCKVNLSDVTVHVGQEQVYSFTINDTKKSKRVQTFVPEVIPGYPGVARAGQEVPVVFLMPDSYSVSYTATGASEKVVYHNKLKNSYADEGMNYWTDTSKGNNLPVITLTGPEGNKFWATSGANSMEQTIDLSPLSFPSSAWDGKKRLKIGAIASIIPYGSRVARVSILSESSDNTVIDSLTVADLPGKVMECVSEFKLLTIDSKAKKVKMLVEAQAEDINKRSYEGPIFDNLCLLLPTDGQSVKNEDVLIFKMGTGNATIDYTPTGVEATMSVAKTDHANVTLINTVTGEEGQSVSVMENDVITFKGKADAGYAVYHLKLSSSDSGTSNARSWTTDDEEEGEGGEGGEGDDDEELALPPGYALVSKVSVTIDPVSIDMDANETIFRYKIASTKDFTITPYVDQQRVLLMENYGGHISVDKQLAKKGETVIVTIKPKEGNKFKQIKTVPANAVQFKQEQVDQDTGAGTYSFVMPTSYLTLRSEFDVTLTTAQEIDSISQQHGTFRLGKDLDLGNNWNKKKITLTDVFDGNGHRITYGGNTSLFHTIDSTASVRHLYVSANVTGAEIGEENDGYMGGICSFNNGIIEDCEVSGSVKNRQKASFSGGIAGLNGQGGQKGTIAYCHVLCDGLDAPTSYGVAQQSKGSVIKHNVFSGMFVAGDTRNYMICNDQDSVIIEDNYYVPSAGNSRAVLCKGVTAKTSAAMTDVINDAAQACYVYTASLKSKYVGGCAIKFSHTTNDTLVYLSTEAANAGTLVTASVRVSGNNHLECITIAAPDGSDSFQCPFTDNTENVYTFSFTMPAHEVLITTQVQEGQLIYTATQFASINNKSGIFYLARDIDLNNWEKAISLKGTFHGRGHTIRFHNNGTTLGLFDKIKPGAVLEGLRVAGVVEATKNCAGIAYDNQGTIRNCHFCGQIKRVKDAKSPSSRRIAALVYKNSGNASVVDHCSATGVLTNTDYQAVVDNCPLYAVSDKARMKDCVWISEQNATAQERQKAQALLNDYPVYAQGILDRIDARIITGNHSQTVTNGQTLAELTITDGEPFLCTNDVKVNRVIYKRKATKNFDEWVLPFAFTQMAGDGTFTYCEVKNENNQPVPGPENPLTLSNTPQSVAYTFNMPWLISNGVDGEERTYVLSNADGSPITIKATSDHRVARYKSIMDIGSFFAAYDTIPAKIVSSELMYAWNGALGEKGEFVLSDGSTTIQPNRFYLQFYSSTSKKTIKYGQTQWAKMANAQPATKAPRRVAEAVADGWQPIFLDPREPQNITARMLDYYDVAYLADIRGEVLDEYTDTPLAAVSLVYMMADGYMELPPALPLLVRVKRSDAKPLVDAKTGAELEELVMQMMMEEEEISESDIYDEDYDEDEDGLSDFDIPHYWCGSFDNRLDIWQLPAPVSYADLSEYGCMMFNDNYYDQTFLYAKANDTRSTSPMSYCITLFNAETYELLPLLGDRVYIEFLQTAAETTGVFEVNGVKEVNDDSWYTVDGRKLSDKPTAKGLYIQNGRKVIKR